jgi:putative oxidoreductase
MGAAKTGAAMREYGLLFLRLALAAVFVAHGGQKLFGIWGGSGLTSMAGIFKNLGLEPAYPLALLVGLTEFFGGVCIALGAFVRVAAPALITVMAVAIWKVHASNGFFINWYQTPGVGHGYEFNIVLIGSLACLMFMGAGALSVDSFRERSAESEAAGRARLRAGKV